MDSAGLAWYSLRMGAFSRLALMSLVILISCGPQEISGDPFIGTFAGVYQVTVTCSDGSNATNTNSEDLRITAGSAGYVIQTNSCDVALNAVKSDSSLSVQAGTCPPRATDDMGNTATLSIDSGTLALLGTGGMSELLEGRSSLSAAPAITCRVALSGNLSRQ